MAADAVHEDVAVGFGKQVHVDLHVAVGVDRVAAALQGKLGVLIAFQNDRRMVLIVSASEIGVQVDARAVVFRIVVRVVDRAVADKPEMILRHFAVSADEKETGARRQLLIAEHDGIVQFQIGNGDVYAVFIEGDGAAAQARLGQVQRLARLYRLVHHVQHGLVHFFIEDVQGSRFALHGVACLIGDDTGDRHLRGVLLRGGDHQGVGLGRRSLQGKQVVSVRQLPLIGSDLFRIFHFHVEACAVRIVDFHALRLLCDDRTPFCINRALRKGEAGADGQCGERQQNQKVSARFAFLSNHLLLPSDECI